MTKKKRLNELTVFKKQSKFQYSSSSNSFRQNIKILNKQTGEKKKKKLHNNYNIKVHSPGIKKYKLEIEWRPEHKHIVMKFNFRIGAWW